MSVEFHTDDDDSKWVSCDACTVGDYGGHADFGEANIRALERDYPDCHRIWHWAYNTRQLYLTYTPEHEEVMRQLDEDYPLYDESTYSEVQVEWEEEAWRDYICSDLLRTLPSDLRDWADEQSEEMQWQWYRDSMEAANEYPYFEGTSAGVRIDKIKDEFRTEVEAECVQQAWEIAQRLCLTVQTPFPILADRIADDGNELLACALRECREEEVKDEGIIGA